MDFSETASLTPATGHWASRLAVKINRYKMLLRSHWWVLLLLISMGLAYQGWVVFSTPVSYQSIGKMMVSAKLRLKEGSMYDEDLINFYGQQIEFMQSEAVLERARKRVILEQPTFSGSAKISAAQVPHTSTFTLVGTGSEPDYTQAFVNAVMHEFVAYKRDKQEETTDSAMGNINQELAQLRKELEQKETQLTAFIEENNMAFWDEQSTMAASFLSQLKTQQANLDKELRLLRNLSTDQLLSHSGASTLTPSPVAEVTADGVPVARAVPSGTVGSGDLQAQYIMSRQLLFQKQAMIESLSKNLKPKHPKLVRMNEEVADIQRLIDIIKDQSKEASVSRTAAIEAELKSIKISIASWEKKVLVSSKKGSEYKRIEGTVTRTRGFYEQLLLSIQSLDISKSVNQAKIQVMQSASPAHEVPPQLLKHLLLGLLFGLLPGIAVLVVMDRADDRITSFSELNEHFLLPILGQIPQDLTARKSQGIASELLSSGDERYMFAEAFRNLRSSLVFMPNHEGLKTLLVTSSIPGEGKSTISANLAITMAISGTRVLLIDGDLKRGDLAEMFKIDGKLGFASVLRDGTDWRTVLQPTDYENLTLLPRGPIATNPSELLLQQGMKDFLAEVREAYDLVIFNSAPILATDDTTTLAPGIDGVLMVVRAFMTSTRLAENSLNALHQRQAKLLGLILNAVDTEVSDYYHYRYSQYYSKRG